MSELTEKAHDIDDLLEQVALALAGGDNDTVSRLLPKIMASGDEVQQLMAESYQMQLDALLEMEQAEAELSGFLDKRAVSDSDIIEEFDQDMGEDEAEPTVTEPTVTEPEVAEPQVSILETAKPATEEIEATAVAEEKDEPVSEAVETSETLDTASVELSADEAEAEELVESSDIAELFEETFVVDASDASSEDSQESAEALIASSEQSPESREVDLALEQIGMLLAEGEHETADMLLQGVPLDADYINADQRREAEDYTVLINALSQPSETAEPVDTELTDSVDSVIDSTESVVEAAETSSDIAAETTDNEAAFEDIFDKVFVQTDSFAADSSNAVINEYANVINAESGDAQTLSSQMASHTPETAVTEDTDSMAVTADSTSIDAVGESQDETAAPVVAETFSDDEAVDHLLSPTQALSSSSFVFSGTDALPQSLSLSDEAKNQRQGFFVGDVGLMIGFADGEELTEIPSYYRVPNSPNWLLGLTNLHGLVIPIFSLQQYLNLDEPTSKGKQMLLVLQHEEKAVGIVINGLPRRLTYQASQRMEKNTSPSQLSGHVHDVYLLGEQLWFDLDTDSLCAALEQGLAA